MSSIATTNKRNAKNAHLRKLLAERLAAKPAKAKQEKAKRQPRPSASEAKRNAWANKFRIPTDMLNEAEVAHVTNDEARKDYGLRAPAGSDLTGLMFPYLNDKGEISYCRVRRDNYDEDEGEKKYHGNSSEDSERILYRLRGAAKQLEKGNTIPVLVESEKAVLALTAWAQRMGREDLVFFGMGGAYGWKSKEHGVLPDLALFNGRKVIILLDANVNTNRSVRAARLELTAELHSREGTAFHANLPQMEGVNGPDDVLARPDGDQIINDVFAEAEIASVAPHSEHALAERFAAENKGKVIYVIGLGWHIWDTQRWKPDDEGRAEILAQELCRTAASECPKPSEQNKLRSRRTREAILREAQVHLAVNADELDKDGMLLNTPGGTVDLRTGELRPARPEDYCTKIAGVAPNMQKPFRWLKFMSETTKSDKELADYQQRYFGYCLTGSVLEQVLQFLYGTGANGKSVHTETMQNVLGDYAKTAQAENRRRAYRAKSISAAPNARSPQNAHSG
jgi:hypothetical protein